MAEQTDRYACWVCDQALPELAVCTKDAYRYVQCPGCGVVRQYPYPSAEETSQYYERYAAKKSAKSEYLTDAGFAAFVRDKKFTFGDLGIPDGGFRDKRLCDVGCATGQFVKMMGEYGASRAFGIDIGEEGIAIARSRKLDCVQGNFLDLRETFDVITMWHLIEHLPRPRSFVEHAYRSLSDGGWFFVETPNVGPVASAFGEHWRFYMPVEHINLFTQAALFRICRDAGFTLKSWVSFGSGNDSGVVPPVNKRAMDTLTKKLGVGDVVAAWFVK
jgi:2-polyprenyl-3-methyl-5-hydroxy-6-metoxy-1,4-benzoquinol methylase